MVHVEWKKVGMGVLAASLGAAAFGAVHYMFLANQAPAGGLFGISYSVIVPIVLGAVGFLASGMIKSPIVKEIVAYGSAAAIGFGIATYANWVAPKTTAAARASAPMAAAIPRFNPPATTPSTAGAGIKVI